MNSVNPGDYSKRPDWQSAALIAAHCLVVFLPLYLAAASDSIVVWVLSFLWFGTTVHGLLNLMHECAHYHTFRSRVWCDRLAKWFLGPAVFTDFEAYRVRHWDHHRHLGEAEDTKVAYRTPISYSGVLKVLWRCLTLQEAARKWRLQAPSSGNSVGFDVLLPTAVVQFCVLFSLVWSAYALGEGDLSAALWHGVGVYTLVYGFGLASLASFVSTLRTIAEHQPGSDDAPQSGAAVLRDFRCGPFLWLMFGAYGFCRHATHHRYPAIPSYWLGVVAKQASKSGEIDGTYLSTLAMLIRGGTPDTKASSSPELG